MRTIIQAERDLLAADRFRIRPRIEVEDADGDWLEINPIGFRDFFISARWSESLETPVMMGTLTLSRSVLGLSFAPTMQGSLANHHFDIGGDYDPLIRGGQKLRISTACFAPGGAPVMDDWKEVFLGVIDDPEWGDSTNFITLAIADIGAFLTRQQIREEREYSTDAGVPVETIMQQILDDNENDRLGPIALYVPASPGWNIRKFKQAPVSVMDALRALAQQIGWELRFRYDAAGDFRLTFYSPERDKVDADTSFAPTEYFQIPSIGENTQDIRNWIRVYFIDKATGERMYAEYKNQESHDSGLGWLYMEVGEDAASNIDSMVEAQAMVDAIGADLSQPPLTQVMRTSYFWAAQLGDLYAFEPNGVHYDVEQKLAVISIEHVLSRTERSTTIGCRGKPAAAYSDWLKLSGVGIGTEIEVDSLDFLNFRESKREADGISYSIDGVTPTVDSIMVYQLTVANPVTGDPFQVIRESVTPAIYEPDTDTWKFSYPPSDSTKYIQIEARGPNLEPGGVRRVVLQAQGTKPWFVELKQTPNLSGAAVALRLVINDALLKGGTLKAWVNRSSTASADPTLAPDGTLAIASTPKTVTNADSFALTGGGTDTLFAAVPIHNGQGKSVFFEFINADGLSSGIERFTLLANGSVIDEDGELTDGSIKTALQFASAIQPVQVFATTLPEPAADGTFAFLISTGKLYRRVSGAWTSAVPAVDITGQVVQAQIADAAINTAKFAAGIRPVRIVGALPGSGDLQGDTVFLTTDNKLYRWTGSAWTAATAAADLTGQIGTVQIANDAVTTVKIATGNITNALIAANAVQATQIASDAVTTPKILAGAITTAKIAAGAVTANEIAALTILAGNIAAGAIITAKIAAGAVTANEIAADTITAGQIAAGAINTSELAAGAVIASKIAAGTITANEIAANTITAGQIASATITATQIASATITSTQIAANTIIAGNIAAGAINTTALAAGAVTATKINVASLASISTDMGIVVAGKLTSVNGQSYVDLNATGSNAFIRHATSGGVESLRLNADGSASFGGTVTSVTFTGLEIDLEYRVKIGRNRTAGLAESHAVWLYGDTSAIAYGIVFSIDTIPYGSSSDPSGDSGFTANLRGANFDFGYAYNFGVMMAKVIAASGSGPSGSAPEGTIWCEY